MGLRSGAVNGGAFVKMDDTGLGSKEFTSEDLVLRVVHAVVRSKKNQFTLIAQNRSPGTAGIPKKQTSWFSIGGLHFARGDARGLL